MYKAKLDSGISFSTFRTLTVRCFGEKTQVGIFLQKYCSGFFLDQRF